MKKKNNLLSTMIPSCLQFVLLISIAVIAISFIVSKILGGTNLEIGKIIFWNVEYFFVLALFMELYDWTRIISGKKLFLITGLYSLSFVGIWLSGHFLILNFWMLGSMLLAYVMPSYLAVAFHIILTISYCFIQNGSVEEFICYFTFGTMILLLAQFLGKIKNMLIIAVVAVTTNYAFIILLNDFDVVNDTNAWYTLLSTVVMIVFLWVVQVALDPLNTKEVALDKKLMGELKSYSPYVYEHCIAIGELSKKAAKVIHVNEELAYVAGCYHEIGRLGGKEYIPEGVKILSEHGVAKQVIQAVEEHNILQSAPSSPEATLVMLSDSIISTMQFLKEKQPERKMEVKDIVNTVFMRRFEKGIFDKSTLSMEEIAELKEFYTKELEVESERFEKE